MPAALMQRPRDEGGRDGVTGPELSVAGSSGRREGPAGASGGLRLLASRLSGTFLSLFRWPSLWCCAVVAPMDQDAGLRAQGSGCRKQGSGCWVQGSGCWVQGTGLRKQGSGCRVQGSGCRAQSSGCWVLGSQLRAQRIGGRAQSWSLEALVSLEPICIGDEGRFLWRLCSLCPMVVLSPLFPGCSHS